MAAVPRSLLLPRVSIFLFSRTGGVLAHLNSLTHMSPRYPLRNFCFLITIVVSSLVLAATHTAFVKLISLELAEPRILHAALVVIRPKTPHLFLNCPTTDSLHRSLFGDSFSRSSGPDPGEWPGFWESMVSHQAFISRKGSGNSNKDLFVIIALMVKLPKACCAGEVLAWLEFSRLKFYLV